VNTATTTEAASAAEVDLDNRDYSMMYRHIPTSGLAEVEALVGSSFTESFETGEFYQRSHFDLGEVPVAHEGSEGFGALAVCSYEFEAVTESPKDLGHAVAQISVHRVVTSPLGDPELTETAKDHARRFLKRQAKPGNGRDRFGGLGKAILAKSSDPVARRLSTVVDARQDLALAEARLELQEALSERGLGKINGLDLKDLDMLSADDFTFVLHRIVKGYSSSTPSGALYYVAAKGLSSEDFDAFYDASLTRLGWTREGTEIAFAFTGVTGVELSSDQVKAFADDAPGTLLELLKTVVPTLDREVQRKLGLSEVFSQVGESLDELLVQSKARSVSEVLADADASDLEVYAALAQARDAGVDPLDPDVRALYAGLTKHLRITMIRQDGRKQAWAATALMGKRIGA
jgi:hypothetical protein